MALQVKAKIVYNKIIGEHYFCCALEAAGMAVDVCPGQFVNIKITGTDAPLLRRPFSIHRVRGAHIEILYEVVGKGSQLLSEKKPGEYLDIIGPLGNGFDYASCVPRHSSLVLVAGGMGVAPLIFLAEKLREIPNPKFQIPTLVLIGAKTKKGILCEKEFKKLGCEVKIATNDGSRGFKGKVTGLLEGILRTTQDAGRRTLYACGPKPMLKEINRLSRKFNLTAQVSLEAHMACGIGACLGCVVDTKDGYKRVCKEGPVFNADEIIW